MQVQFEARGVGSALELQPGTWTVGGAADDGIHFPGLPPRLLELDVELDRTWVRCTRPLRVGRAVLEAGVRRWLLPGEPLRLSRQAQIRIAPPTEAAGTMALVRSLLEPGGTPISSAAPALVCVAGPDAGTVLLLAGPLLEVGRSPACAIRLGDAAVSRRHLELVLDPGGTHRARDLGSRNRTRCNGRWLRRSRLLSDGDLLAVGRSLLHYRRASPGAGGGGDTSERGRRPDLLSPPHQGDACGAAQGRGPSMLSPPHQGDACGAAQGRGPSMLSPPHQGDACGAAQGRGPSMLSASATGPLAPPAAPSDDGAG
jgi:pSer/pThr/pTyr-binding forkhead associated (FHA) protein